MIRAFLIPFLLTFSGLMVQAATCTTTSTTTWDCGTPGQNDDLIVNHNITISGNFTVNNGSITVNAPNTLTIDGDLEFNNNSMVLVADGGCISVTGNFLNKNNSGDVEIFGTLVVAGNFQNGTGSGAGAVIDVGDSGSITIGGTCDNPGTVENDSDSFTGCENVILPVELVNFRGTALIEGNLLQWSTASERNNDFFQVQRSSSGQTWEAIGQVAGAGDSDEFLNYNFHDYNPLPGRNFYRLKQVDFDGAFEYSYIVSVVTGDLPFLQIQAVYPNPSNGQVEVQFISNEQSSIQYELYNNQGKLIYGHKGLGMLGFNRQPLNYSNVAGGSYVLRVTKGALSRSIRVIKLP